MRLRTGFLLATFLVAALSAYGSTVVIDNFSCPDSVSLTGATGFNDNVIACPVSIGGVREDYIIILSSDGTGSSVSTMNSNPPAGAITGTFGAGIDAFEGMTWGNLSTDDLNLNLVGDSILVQIQSDSGGTLTAGLCTSITSGSSTCNGDNYSATFSGSSSYQDVLLPLTGTPTDVLGSGGNLGDVNIVNVFLSLDTPGSTYTIDAVDAISTPEPSPLLVTCVLLAGVALARSFWRRFARQ